MNELTALLPHLKFHFHVDHPTLEECYAYGYECALADVQEDDNPYQVNSPEQEQWLEGWWAGFYNEQPLFSFDIEPENNRAVLEPVNDASYHAEQSHYFLRVLEIAGVIAVSALLSYQVIDIVA
ncbi:MAG: transmission trait enhancer LetE [Gammaproteobacteria bacterium]|nr:transmission trait enhancer LetE [Gammaproteobacteria bacterium]MCH9764213.1 transmission trait enhancer LetE [Gammaproteobacteria bacterium]